MYARRHNKVLSSLQVLETHPDKAKMRGAGGQGGASAAEFTLVQVNTARINPRQYL